MRDSTRYTLGSVVLGSFVLLSGCGSNEDTRILETGRMVGGLIENVPYVCGSTTGKTGRLGQFRYKAGDACAFNVGKLGFPVAAAKVLKGYVTAYDLTGTETEAWTLMAILGSISHQRAGDSGLLMVVDGNLESRIPLVNLKDGDTAVEKALATFAGTVPAVKVRDAQNRLAQTVRTDNSLVVPLETLVAQGKAILDSNQIATETGVPYLSSDSAAQGTTPKSNHVNLRFYDYQGNPWPVNSANAPPRGLPYGGDPNQLVAVYVKPEENPDNNTPLFGPDKGDMSGPNIVGFNLKVGRHDSEWVGTGFQTAAFWPGPGTPTTPAAPISILAHGAHPSASENSAYPQKLNFSFSSDLVVGNGSTGKALRCDNLIFAQSTTKTSLKAVFKFLYKLTDTVLEGAELAAEDGSDIEADYSFLGSIKDLAKDAINLGNENWWIVAINAQTPSYRMSIHKNPALMMACKSSDGVTIPVVITSTHDDHTFDVYVTFPGQRLKGVGGYALPPQ